MGRTGLLVLALGAASLGSRSAHATPDPDLFLSPESPTIPAEPSFGLHADLRFTSELELTGRAGGFLSTWGWLSAGLDAIVTSSRIGLRLTPKVRVLSHEGLELALAARVDFLRVLDGKGGLSPALLISRSAGPISVSADLSGRFRETKAETKDLRLALGAALALGSDVELLAQWGTAWSLGDSSDLAGGLGLRFPLGGRFSGELGLIASSPSGGPRFVGVAFGLRTAKAAQPRDPPARGPQPLPPPRFTGTATGTATGTGIWTGTSTRSALTSGTSTKSAVTSTTPTTVRPELETLQPTPSRTTSAPPPKIEADADDDGLPDTAERLVGTDSERADTDGDGLSDAAELRRGKPRSLDPMADTDPLDADTDDDGLSDGLELAHGAADVYDEGDTNPRDADTDDDGISDGEESRLGDDGFVTLPRHPDTDRDGLLDGLETSSASVAPGKSRSGVRFDGTSAGFLADQDPSTQTSPLSWDSDRGSTSDGDEDADHDGAVDPGERDPNDPADDDPRRDRDRDGAPDRIDNCPYLANPEQADSDDDGYGDACELDVFPSRFGETGILDVPHAEPTAFAGGGISIGARADGSGLTPSPVAINLGLGWGLELGLSWRQGGQVGDGAPAPTLFASALKLALAPPVGYQPGFAVDLLVDRLNASPSVGGRMIASTEAMERLRLAAYVGGASSDGPVLFRPVGGAAVSLALVGPLELAGQVTFHPKGQKASGALRFNVTALAGLALGGDWQSERGWAGFVNLSFHAPSPHRRVRRPPAPPPIAAPPPSVVPTPQFRDPQPRLRFRISPSRVPGEERPRHWPYPTPPPPQPTPKG
ncbi:MAG: hypothetical protein HY791_35980 [Deltaproteobacteria bacterium]|nr:hypothetical protein [Deltaproteobacteria bacterium]